MTDRSKNKEWGSLVLFILICLGAGFLGVGVTSRAITDWYGALHKPPGTPPNWIFGPVWALLYVFMAVSVWRIWRTRVSQPVSRELMMFAIQLVLNALWTPVFFGLRKAGLALFVIMVLWRMIYRTLRAFQKIDGTAAKLLTPYLAWVTYAAYLNAGIWWLNR